MGIGKANSSPVSHQSDAGSSASSSSAHSLLEPGSVPRTVQRVRGVSRAAVLSSSPLPVGLATNRTVNDVDDAASEWRPGV